MRYGIPSYRLPREVIDHQVAEIEELGVEMRYGRPLTADFGVAELRAEGYEAVFLGIGAWRVRGACASTARELDGVRQGHRLPAQHQPRLPRPGRQARRRRRRWLSRSTPRASRCAPSCPASRWRPKRRQPSQATTLRVALDAAREVVRSGAAEVTVVSLESAAEMPAARVGPGPRGARGLRGRGHPLPALVGSAPHPRRGWEGDRHRARALRARVRRHGPLQSGLRRGDDSRARSRRHHPRHRPGAGRLAFSARRTASRRRRPGTIKVDPETLATTAPGVFSGGDGAFPARPPHHRGRSRASSRRAPSTPTCAARAPPRSTLRVTSSSCRRTLPHDARLRDDRASHPDRSRSSAAAASAEVELPSPPRRRRSRPAAASTATRIRSTTASCACCVDAAPTSAPSTASASRRSMRSTSIPSSDGCSQAHGGEEPSRCSSTTATSASAAASARVRCPTAAITMERFHFEESPSRWVMAGAASCVSWARARSRSPS